MNKLIAIVIATAVVVGGGAFYGGMKYAQGQNSRGNFANLTPEQRQQLMANAGGGFRNGTGGQSRTGMNGGGFTSGEIISKDDKSITVKMRDGGSKIVFFSDTTEVDKFVVGTSADLIIGKSVTITGQVNQDGSITAQSIQLRPNLPTPIQ